MSKPRNKFEKRLFTSLKRRKTNFEYEKDKISYYYVAHYTPDFTVRVGENVFYIEAKGYFRPEDKRKLRSVKRMHPALDIRLVFYARNESYIRWATKNGFPWAIGKIPPDWLK